DRFAASEDSGSSNRPSSIAGSGFEPFACDHFVHSGDAHRTSVRGKYRGSSWCRSTAAWSVSGWFWLCVSIASDQWFAAITTRTPGIWTAPVDEPPAPQKRSVTVTALMPGLLGEGGSRGGAGGP